MKKITAKKVPLKEFIILLIDVLNTDAEYVDIVVEKNTSQDSIYIVTDTFPPVKVVKQSEDIDFENLV